ncbi:DUF6290 family protein [Candidatus Stoquefichus sp. SB1]|uniref:DUF6290 family protein n=1 Tax=Candidatus Stoquefichus sp. SB1 TaxID=1658109 RepID=UPI00067F67FB|nr:DUF6290 family protein [Candidatus Stoquefichus sp. SB1]
MLTITLEGIQEEKIKAICKEKKQDVSRFIHELIWDTIEDEELIKKADRAYAEFLKDPVTYSLEEVMRELDIDENI